MRAVIQRVLDASVTVDGEVIGRIEHPGLLVLLGVTRDDSDRDTAWLAAKVWGLRILRDELSLSDLASAGHPAQALVVSQFTLYGDARKGRRPTWSAAAPGEVSEPLYEQFCSELIALGAGVARGRFGADMQVSSTNDGPITLVVDSTAAAK